MFRWPCWQHVLPCVLVMLAQDMCLGPHVFPRGAPSGGAQLGTYLQWFARPNKVHTGHYFESVLLVAKLRSIVSFRVCSHSFPNDQGKLGKPKVPRHRHRCTFCTTSAVGNERPLFHSFPSILFPFATACKAYRGLSI